MRRIVDNDLLTLSSRIIMGAVFLYACYYKIILPGEFAKTIWFYHLLPGSLINLEAIFLPWLELLIGLALILGFWYRGAVLWSNLLLVVFIVALVSTIARGIDVDCGCFKSSGSATGPAWASLWWDVGMLVLTLQLFASRSKKWLLSPV